jgi:hypothetical protein
MTRQEAEDQLLDYIRDFHMDSWPSIKHWDEVSRPVMRKYVQEFIKLIERESCPLA